MPDQPAVLLFEENVGQRHQGIISRSNSTHDGIAVVLHHKQTTDNEPRLS
jgi:hypothetical protein